ncbi:methyltransferase domain-containing protein [Candidatus Micrarchaeota archaeon]|nr:methyltransferase domain-containing protein [Candidatus Micrarchaeota archaeon]
MLFSPFLSKLKRGPQVVLPKDIGMVLAYSGVGKESECVDAGCGSGWLAISLANVAKKITSYEVREEFAQLAEKNAKRAGVSNLEVKRKNVLEGIDEKEVDLVTLDLASSDMAVAHACAALKKGGMLVGYLPHVEQVQKFVQACKAAGFSEVSTIESIVREYLVREAGMRPENTGLTHTAYLVFAKK